jgi:O-antigen ligase
MTSLDSDYLCPPDRAAVPLCEAPFAWPRSPALWMMAGWLALYIIRPWEVLFPSLGGLYFERIYVLTTIAVVAASGKLRLPGSLQDLGVLALFSAVLLSSLCGVAPENTVDCVWIYLIQVVFYFLVVSCVRTRDDLLFMVLCYVAIMAATVGKAEYEYFVHDRHAYSSGGHIRRLIGINTTFEHPNDFGPTAAISLVWVAALWRLRDWVTGYWPRYYQKAYLFGLAVYLVLALSAVILTNSRTAMAAAIFVVILVAVHGRPLRQKVTAAIGAALLLLVVWGMMSAEHRERLRTMWDPTAGPAVAHLTADARTEDFWFGVEMFKKYPLTGAGVDTTKSFRKEFGGRWEVVSHNLYGKLLGETGVIGVGAFLLMVLGVVVNRRSLRRIASQNGSPVEVEADCAQAAIQMLVALLFVGWAGGALQRIEWMWLAAMCQASLTSAQETTAYDEEDCTDDDPTDPSSGP